MKHNLKFNAPQCEMLLKNEKMLLSKKTSNIATNLNKTLQSIR